MLTLAYGVATKTPRRQCQTPITARAKLLDGCSDTTACTASRLAQPPLYRIRHTPSPVPCASAQRAPMRILLVSCQKANFEV